MTLERHLTLSLLILEYIMSLKRLLSLERLMILECISFTLSAEQTKHPPKIKSFMSDIFQRNNH